MQNLLDQLTRIFRDVFDDEELTITTLTSPQNLEGWDSLAHIRIILAIEKEFGINFTAAEISAIESICQVTDLISTKQREVE